LVRYRKQRPCKCLRHLEAQKLSAIAVCLLDHSENSSLRLINFDDAEDVAVPKQIRADWTNRQLVCLDCLHVDEYVACVITRHNERVPIHVEVSHLCKAPTSNVELFGHRVSKNTYNSFLFMVNKNEFIVVPRDSQEFVLLVLQYPVNELFCLIAQIIEKQLHCECLLICLHCYEVDTCVRAHHYLV
jgi:hypothetical protein